MPDKGKKSDGRSNDLAFHWLTSLHGNEWEAWRAYAEAWINVHDVALSARRCAITWFLDSYLVKKKFLPDPDTLFGKLVDLSDLLSSIEITVRSNNKFVYNNYIVDFVDWIIAKDYSELNDYGQPVPLVINPFKKEKKKYSSTETVWNPLPYSYIKELRTILCPYHRGHFRDWTWAHQAGQENGKTGMIKFGEWFEVDPILIDKTDPDCVWRERVLAPGKSFKINSKRKILKERLSIFEIWSPVRSMVIYLKLLLPLRTYQVRMLDSGEADTWRYEHGEWQRNIKHDFVLGNEKAPWQGGVFRRQRSLDTFEWHTGIYINTNKTADQSKDTIERGYVIPWQHDEVLYWIEKLRNWQEKYNPISKPTPWLSLLAKHTGEKKSKKTLMGMGSTCFLFREASAVKQEDREKPVTTQSLQNIWYRLLLTLENHVFDRGQTLKGGLRLRFVKEYDTDTYDCHKVATEFPLHSLRVSLITCYAMEGQVPLPVLSKLVAGHSRIIMTLYYCKVAPSVMRDKMLEAEVMIENNETEALKNFLTDADLNQIKNKAVFRDVDSISAILVNRNPLGWEQRHIGLCLSGGNTIKSNEKDTITGCWNGGELIKDTKAASKRVFAPVAHGPENCVRCRWFITDVSYLNVLVAHCNNLSYRAFEVANLALESEQSVETLQDIRSASMSTNSPFTKIAELQKAERRYEKQLVDADEYTKDFLACFTLIHRIVNIESNRSAEDNHQKLIAVGKLHDIWHPISLLETQSELLQLSGICEDAEIYSDLSDELRKTPAIEKRSRILNMALMREGYQPIFLSMDEKMQLIAGNAMMRAMAKQACSKDWQIEGMQRVTGIIEAEKSLRDFGLINSGIKALEQCGQQSAFSLNSLPTKPKLELIYDDN